MRTAILVLSRGGLALARRLRAAAPDPGGVAIFGPACVVGDCDAGGRSHPGPFATGEPGVSGWSGPLRRVFARFWEDSDRIVAIMALGIVVRLIGPLAGDKRRDPAVVAVDDAGRFAISVLGGHGAGANELAGWVAGVLGATPVVTTASESHNLPAVDRIGADLGWTIERAANLTRAAAAVVRGRPVAVWQDAGPASWWESFGPWPGHFTRVATREALEAVAPEAVLFISDRVAPGWLPGGTTIVYRPPSLVAGVGCKRGTSRDAIDAWIGTVFTGSGLAEASLAALATVTLKVDEPGLIACAAARGIPLVAFPAAELARQGGIETPSERVREKVGIAAVAEPAALRAAGAARLLVPKQKGPGVTLALARLPNDA